MCSFVQNIVLFLFLSKIICAEEYVKTEEECWKYLKVYSPALYPQYHTTMHPKEPNSIRIFLSGRDRSSSFSNTAYQYNAAALTMAFIEFCRLGLNNGMKDQKFELLLRNDACNSEVGVSSVIDMVGGGADVILGLACSSVTIHGGYFLRHWNVPAISFGAGDPVLDDKDTYDTFIRMGHMLKFTGNSFMEVMHTYNWQTFSILTSLDVWYCEHGSTYTYISSQQQTNVTVAEYIRVEGNPTDKQLLLYLRNFKDRARVLLVCLEQEDMIRLMELAYDEGMVNSEYVYFSIQSRPSSFISKPWGDLTGLDEASAKKRRAAFTHLKMITFPATNSPQDLTFKKKVEKKMSEFPWFDNSAQAVGISDSSSSSLLLYDIMWFYLTVVNRTLSEHEDPRNGTLLFHKARNYSFKGLSGEINMDNFADRVPNYYLWQIKPGDDEFYNFATYTRSSGMQAIVLKEPPYWGTPDGKPPLNEPLCGYRHERCPPSTERRDAALIGGFSCFALFIIAIFSGVLFYRKRQFEDDLQKMTWKIFKEDIEMSTRKAGGSQIGLSLASFKSIRSSESTKKSQGSVFSLQEKEQIFTKVGIFKGLQCAIKTVEKIDCKLTRTELIELKMLKDLTHENINSFIGASIDPPEICILTSYCAKGSLQDILEHDEIKLDWMFKCSLISDLVHGLDYIHNSEIISHGHLNSGNCLIDSRWVLKIGNVGLRSILRTGLVSEEETGEYVKYKKQLWTAPELLRVEQSKWTLKGTPKGDIYSLAIILQEVLFRALPYFMEDMPPKDIVQNVQKSQDPPYRPVIPAPDADTDKNIIYLMQDCWQEVPSLRPDTHTIRKRLTKMNKGRKVNILDSMVQKLEKYANNLEDIVERRTEELVTEKKKTDSLLYRMLPSVVADKLKHGLSVPAEIYESVSIYFSDVVGFTSISSDSSPMEVVDLLNDLYTLFDDILERHDVYKVETIGDAYMVASGCPNRNGDKHAVEIANMSLSLLDSVENFKIRHIPDRKLQVRIGMHSGSCAAGVVGLTMPRYCLFGDTINVASRMESNGEAMKIHMSQQSYETLKISDTPYNVACRGKVNLKGKGAVVSYWLLGYDQASVC